MANTPSYSNPFQMDMLMLDPVHKMMHKGIRIDMEQKTKLHRIGGLSCMYSPSLLGV